MLTGELRSQVDGIWNDFWSGGLANPLQVIEQITYLIFIKRLDEIQEVEERKGGEVGPPPDATIGEVRASIYSQSESASELRAFAKVASVAAAELASAAVVGLEAGQIIVTYSALRGFIERTAHTTALSEALKSLDFAPIDGPLTPVLELSEVIHKALYATHREWTKVIGSDLRKTSSMLNGSLNGTFNGSFNG